MPSPITYQLRHPEKRDGQRTLVLDDTYMLSCSNELLGDAMTAVPEGNELDAMVAAPDHHEVLLENERVRVLDTRLAPGQRTPIHTHASFAALYPISWSDFLRRDAQENVIVDFISRERRPAIRETL